MIFLYAACAAGLSILLPAVGLSFINTNSTLSFNNQNLIEMRILLAYLVVGTSLAVCGCGLLFTGLKRLFVIHEHKIKNASLASIGISLLLLGLHVALGNIALV